MWCANYKEKKGKTQADIRHGPHASDHTHQPTHLKIPLQEPLEQHGAMTDQRTKSPRSRTPLRPLCLFDLLAMSLSSALGGDREQKLSNLHVAPPCACVLFFFHTRAAPYFQFHISYAPAVQYSI